MGLTCGCRLHLSSLKGCSGQDPYGTLVPKSSPVSRDSPPLSRHPLGFSGFLFSGAV